MNVFVNSVLECIQTGLAFVLNPDNLQVTMGVGLIFTLIYIFSKGVGKVFDAVITFCIVLYILFCILQHYGITIDFSSLTDFLGSLAAVI